MEWTIEHLAKDNIVSAIISGVMTWDENNKFIKELSSLAKKHNSRKVLVEYHGKSPDFTVLQIDDMPKIYEESGAGPGLKIALVHDLSPSHSSQLKFFRDAMSIKSIGFKLFTDKDKATA
ncbi:MAG: hypothetical protein ABSB11_04610 [Sedimentisphaerales bacterium]|jgi:hypothetical protein